MSKQEQDGTLIEIIKPKIAVFEDTPLRDPRLSWRAKGIIAYLLSKPPGWQIWTGDLVRRSADGKAAVFAGLKELETFGYLKRERSNDARGRLQWRKTLSAIPETMWTDDDATPETAFPTLPAPSPEKPVMAATQPPCTDLPYMVNQDMVPPCTDLPCMVSPCMVNRTHSISNCSTSNSNEEREGGATATPSEEVVTDTPTPATAAATPEETAPEPEGLAVVRRICDDCFIKIAPETVYGYSTVAHIVAEAARWWDETPAHLRPKNAGMLVYRIKTRQFKPLTQAEIVACTPYYRWLHGDTEEPVQEALPITETITRPTRLAPPTPALSLDPDNPHAVWQQVLAEFALELPSNQLDTWIQDSQVLQYEDGHFTVGLPNGRYLDWAEDRLRPHIKRKLASIMQRNSIDISFSVAQAA